MAKEIFTAEWFPYYFERFEGSDKVAVMSLAEEGAYHRAIRLAWKYGSVPANPEMLAAKIQKRCTVKIAEKVLECFEPMPDNPSRMWHPVVEEIRETQERKYLNRVKGGKAAAKGRKISVANKDTSSISPAQLEQQSSSKRERERDLEKKEEKEKRNPAAPAREIFIGTVQAGVVKARNIKKLSPSESQEWANHAGLAFDNGFSAADFIACFVKIKEKYATVRPQYVTDRIEQFVAEKAKTVSPLRTLEQVEAEQAAARVLPPKRTMELAG